MVFRKKARQDNGQTGRLAEFSYISENDIYLDSACQSVRPQPVIDALSEYYTTYNACGGRVKYKWGQKVDGIVEETRELLLDFLKLPKKDYVCSFTLNTTYGLNLILNQLPEGKYERVVTSEIEHNSVFLSTIELAKRLGIERKLLEREENGSLKYEKSDLKNALVVVNATSNIDGRLLNNVKKLVEDVHAAGGAIIIDAAQAMAHYHELLAGIEADAICFSGHKMYSASLGIVIIRKQLLNELKIKYVGGGMVSGVEAENYTLLPDDLSSRLEPGLQAYGEIICLNKAIKWLANLKINGLKPSEYINQLSERLYNGLKEIPGLIILNKQPSSVISFYSPNIDAHRLAIFLSGAGIMTRSGYFCCHYYLLTKLQMPPLVRLSIGLHNTEADIDKVLESIRKFTSGK